MSTRISRPVLFLALTLWLPVVPALAEPLSSQDREAIDRLRTARGHSAGEVNQLMEQVNRAGEKGLPTEALANKVKEGLAKGVEPRRIDPVLKQMVGNFESAREVLQESVAKGMIDQGQGNRERAMESLAEAFSRGATADEVRDLARSGQHQGQRMSPDMLGVGAKSLAVIKEASIPSKDGAAVVAEGMRQGFRPSELADLARDIKRHGKDFQEGRLTTESIRDQISRGERGDRLFRDEDHSGSGGGDRMDRGKDSDRGGRDDRGDRSDRSGGRDDRGRQDDRGGGGHGGRDH
ncbi:MAG: hypothetical protein CAF41_013425 [Nitrospira sp. CG24A]|nr:MAG: hypothetical protein CAF41_013425 [Nitrospira sp. CG24A]